MGLCHKELTKSLTKQLKEKGSCWLRFEGTVHHSRAQRREREAEAAILSEGGKRVQESSIQLPFSFCFHPGPQPLEGCHPHLGVGWIFPLHASNLETPSQL